MNNLTILFRTLITVSISSCASIITSEKCFSDNYRPDVVIIDLNIINENTIIAEKISENIVLRKLSPKKYEVKYIGYECLNDQEIEKLISIHSGNVCSTQIKDIEYLESVESNFYSSRNVYQQDRILSQGISAKDYSVITATIICM